MSTLVLIRHGQARAFEANSDRLTERGIEQATALGMYLASTAAEFDEVHVGTLERQQRTAEFVGNAFRTAGKPWPDASVDRRWNEYDADGILKGLLPILAASDPDFSALVSDFQARVGSSDHNRYFQRMFEVLMDRWERGDVAGNGVESFSAFHERATAAFREITSRRGSRRLAVFTSGGPIGVSVALALDAPPRSALRVNWRVRNASLTEMLFSGGRISLDSFNIVEYLPPELRTFR